MMRTPGVLLLLVLAAACDRTGSDRSFLKPPPPDPAAGPSKEQVAVAWQAYAQNTGDCLKYMRFNDLEIEGTSISGNQAIVLIIVSGDWFNQQDEDPIYLSGPCGGFHRRAGSGQRVERKLLFTRYDTGWRFESTVY